MGRYKIQFTEYGARIYDNLGKREMTLQQICDSLNQGDMALKDVDAIRGENILLQEKIFKLEK